MSADTTTALMPLAKPGQQLGHYVLVERIGRGGMSTVFRALDTRLGRTVAVKLLRHESVEDLARFAREAALTAKLDHPHIAKIFDVSVDPPYLVMPCIDGCTLGKWRGDRVVALRDAARAIHYAHEQGVLHRDLKPDNIMVDRAGHAFVLDFGLARPLAAGWSVTQGALLGTPGFMAPEQAEGERERFGPRTDVYGLGATLYALLAGRPPHDGSTGYAILHSVVEDDIEAPTGPRELVAIAMTALAKNPESRYPSAEAFADDLDRYLAGHPVAARPQSMFTRMLWRIRRHPVPWVLGAALALALLIGAAVSVVLLLRAHASLGRALSAEHALRAVESAQRQDSDQRAELAVCRHELEELDDILAGELEPEELAAVDAQLQRIRQQAAVVLNTNPAAADASYVVARAAEFARDDATAAVAYAQCIAHAKPAAPIVGRAWTALAMLRWRQAILACTPDALASGQLGDTTALLAAIVQANAAQPAGDSRRWLRVAQAQAQAQALATGDRSPAKTLLRAALARGGRTESLLALAAITNFAEPAAAIEVAQRDLRQYHAQPAVWVVLAAAQQRSGADRAVVMESLRQAQRLAPDSVRSPLALAVTLAMTGAAGVDR